MAWRNMTGPPMTTVSDLKLVEQERDLYRRLLELGTTDELEGFLADALGLVADVTGAQQAYLEVRDPHSPDDRSWSLVHGCEAEQVDDIRGRISRGVIAEALSTGETILTDSAFLDDRFSQRLSVRRNKIDAVICAPIGGDAALGVVYLQGRTGGRPFDAADRERAEMVARHLAPLADRLLVREREREGADATRALRDRHRLDGVLGHSTALAHALEQAMLAAPLNVHVLLTGDSGTGKTQLARVIHDNSPRANGPFVELNCGALPENLVESELFGAVAGAYTEARKDRIGKVAAAAGGTLLLDEIGTLPHDAQTKLLQLLQSKSYFPIGATKPETIDLRLIAATNADLEQEVAAKTFREDLFFRLNVLPIRMPSLAERREDIPDLARGLLDLILVRHELPRVALSRGALQAIESAEWRGNVRQLENAVEVAAIRAAGGGAEMIEASHVFPDAKEAAASDADTFQEATRRFQRDLLAETLADTGWNVAETARRLDLARSHVYNLIRTFELSRTSD
jgi:Nif-specific regulatory protein